jgi:hypothetical protein
MIFCVLVGREYRVNFTYHEDPSAAKPQPNLGISLAKHALSVVEGALRHKGDGPKPVIPRKSEGSKKDFSLRSK